MNANSLSSSADLKELLIKFAPMFRPALYYQKNDGCFQIQYYFCNPVMQFVEILRTSTKTSILSAQHDAFKLLFNSLVYGDRGKTEVKIGNNRVDIFVEDSQHVVEIKTISEISMEKLYDKAIGVIEAAPRTADSLWIFYFYKLAQNLATHPACKYLLVFISIDLMDLDVQNFREELFELVEESKVEVAKNLQIRPALILPLENLIKVEDMERLVEEKDAALQEKDAALQEKDAALQKAIRDKERAIEELQRLKEEISRLKSKN